jgi:hypothetical protein
MSESSFKEPFEEKEKRKIHQPEFIILTSDEEEGERGPKRESLQGEYVEILKTLGGKKFSWSIRLLTFLAAIGAAVGLIFVFFMTLVSTLLAGLTLFMNKEINAKVINSWKNVRKILVILVGLTIGIFSPTLGFGLIILYLMLHGESLKKNLFFSRIFPSN